MNNNSQNNGSTNSSSQPIPEQMSLLGLFANNECPCNELKPNCRKELNITMQQWFRNEHPTIADVKELLYLVKGTQKSMNVIKLVPYCLANIQFLNLPKETFDCFLEVFTVVFLKSEEVFKRAVVADLFQFVDWLLANLQPFFLEKGFKGKFVLFRIYQLQDCIKNPEPCLIK